MKKTLLLLTAISSLNAKGYITCVNCHGIYGEEKALGKTLPIAGLVKEDLTKTLTLYKKGKLNKYGFGGLMKQSMQEVETENIPELAEYISNLKKPENPKN